MRKFCCSLLVAFIWVGLSTAEDGVYKLYKRSNSSGSAEYTDQPTEGYEEILVQEPVRYQGGELGNGIVKRPADSAKTYEKLDLLSPEDGASFRDMRSAIPIQVRLNPGLRAGDSFYLVLDGQQQGQGFRNTVYQLSELDRGSHKLSVRVINEKKQTQIESRSITVHVHKTKADAVHPSNGPDPDAGGSEQKSPSSSFGNPSTPPKPAKPASSSFGGYGQ